MPFIDSTFTFPLSLLFFEATHAEHHLQRPFEQRSTSHPCFYYQYKNDNSDRRSMNNRWPGIEFFNPSINILVSFILCLSIILKSLAKTKARLAYALSWNITANSLRSRPFCLFPYCTRVRAREIAPLSNQISPFLGIQKVWNA